MTSATWATMRLKNLVEPLQTGVWGADPTGDEDDILCVRVADFDRQRFGLKPVRTVRSVPKKERLSRLLRAGDILLEKSGGTEANPVGFTVMFEGDYPAVSSNFIGRIRMKSGQNLRFWLYALAASYFTRRTQKCVRQTTGIQNLDQSAFFDEVFAVPPFEQQGAIADYLDRETALIDIVIEEQQRLVDLLRERRQACIESSVGRGLELATTTTKPSGLFWTREVPNNWEVGNIRRYAAMKTGHTPSRSTPEYWTDCKIPWFTLADVWQLRDGTRNYLGETANRISDLGLANSSAELLPAGTVVLSRTASVGFSGIMPTSMATSQDFWNWIPGSALDAEYLMWTFRAMRSEFQSLMIGSTHKTIYQPTAAAFQIPIPPLEEQRRIVAYVNAQVEKIDLLISETGRFIDLARERRAALITAAVTGQTHVQAVA